MSIRHFSLKKQKIKAEMRRVIEQINKERGPRCEDCGYGGRVDPSHNYSQKDFETLIADPENITLLCRKHHNAFQDNQLWLLKSDYILQKMKEQLLSEPDIFRKERMRSHLVGKLFAAKDNADTWQAVLPGWVDELLNEL